MLWFRHDLRLADNPALLAAVGTGRPVLPLFILDDDAAGCWRPGGASRWWLHHSLDRLAGRLARLGSRLVLRRGPAAEVLEAVMAEAGAAGVMWNRLYEPWAIARDRAIKQRLRDRGAIVESFNAALIAEPWEITTGTGQPYQVFTPFWRALRSRPAFKAPRAAPRQIPLPPHPPVGDRLEDWELLPRADGPGGDWAASFDAVWVPGEASALARLGSFLDDGLAAYPERRDLPGTDGTARLSPHLHRGEIGPRQIWRAVMMCADAAPELAAAAEGFLRELGWREFSHHLLYHWPDLPERPWRRAFAKFPWRDDPAGLRAWQRGMTGYPIVDAGMRELWATGWMHNRVRMIAASFLVKDLLVPWQKGEAWFWDTLVDADLAQNAASWQWVAGSGADAAPYFRIFNPVSQGQKFDPAGDYVRRWVPELASLPDRLLQRPWEAPADMLSVAGVELGRDYPKRCVDHDQARKRALTAWREMRGDGPEG